MTTDLKFSISFQDDSWGCEYFEVSGASVNAQVKLCFVKVKNIQKVSEGLASQIIDTSWMMNLDRGSRRAYEQTVKDTSKALLSIFEKTAENTKVGSEFGEIMVSISSTKALERIFNHLLLPIAELWKPQEKQNEGFDFHTVCTKNFVNFGEAKFSTVKNPHGDALIQAKGFLEVDKHFRDRVHLINLVSGEAVSNLDNDAYGIVASFSIISNNPLNILTNALASVEEKFDLANVKTIYLVGVSQ